MDEQLPPLMSTFLVDRRLVHCKKRLNVLLNLHHQYITHIIQFVLALISKWSSVESEIQISPLKDKPGPPAAFDISEITSESCCLAWNPPRDDGGSPITNYIVECRQTDSEDWVKLSATVKHTTFKACKLTAMKDYIFRISAENQFGIGEPAEHTPITAKYSFGMFLYCLSDMIPYLP